MPHIDCALRFIRKLHTRAQVSIYDQQNDRIWVSAGILVVRGDVTNGRTGNKWEYPVVDKDSLKERQNHSIHNNSVAYNSQ